MSRRKIEAEEVLKGLYRVRDLFTRGDGNTQGEVFCVPCEKEESACICTIPNSGPGPCEFLSDDNLCTGATSCPDNSCMIPESAGGLGCDPGAGISCAILEGQDSQVMGCGVFELSDDDCGFLNSECNIIILDESGDPDGEVGCIEGFEEGDESDGQILSDVSNSNLAFASVLSELINQLK